MIGVYPAQEAIDDLPRFVLTANKCWSLDLTAYGLRGMPIVRRLVAGC